jgi:hypothetical protein
MPGVIATLPKFQFSNALGLPMSGGTITSYLAGTTTLATTYQDEALTSANTNPIALDSRGECMLWLDSTKTYKFVLKNAAGVTQWTVDNVINALSFVDQLRADLAAPDGAALVGYTPTRPSAPATTIAGQLNRLESIAEKVGADSYRIGTQYASMDATLGGVLLYDGYPGYPNKVGINNTRPVTEPPSGARANDTGYIAGAADLAAVVAGYDNISNALAGIIAGYHCMIYSTATHGTILGGSVHAILPGADYATILGGTEHTIQNDCDYGVIVGGERNKLESGSAFPTDYGHRGAILGGVGNTVSGQYGTILNGQLNTTTSIYAAILAGNGCTVSGSYGVASGNTVNVSGAYSVAFGNGITVSGTRSLAHGDEHSVTTDYSTALGYRCKPPFAGAQVHSARQRANVVGANQALEFTCSQETADATLTSLSINGSTTYPVQPASSVVSGNWVITGVDTTTGNVCSYTVPMVSKRGVGTTPTISAGTATTVIDEITVGAVPGINASATGIYRVRVTGKAATSIVWSAVFRGLQIVYA